MINRPLYSLQISARWPWVSEFVHMYSPGRDINCFVLCLGTSSAMVFSGVFRCVSYPFRWYNTVWLLFWYFYSLWSAAIVVLLLKSFLGSFRGTDLPKPWKSYGKMMIGPHAICSSFSSRDFESLNKNFYLNKMPRNSTPEFLFRWYVQKYMHVEKIFVLTLLEKYTHHTSRP
jgi:hypothetical protein